MPLYVFEKEDTITMEVSLEIMKAVMKDGNCGVREFQQEGAAAQTSRIGQNRLSDNVGSSWFKEFWLPKSRDLNLLDITYESESEKPR